MLQTIPVSCIFISYVSIQLASGLLAAGYILVSWKGSVSFPFIEYPWVSSKAQSNLSPKWHGIIKIYYNHFRWVQSPSQKRPYLWLSRVKYKDTGGGGLEIMPRKLDIVMLVTSSITFKVKSQSLVLGVQTRNQPSVLPCMYVYSIKVYCLFVSILL